MLGKCQSVHVPPGPNKKEERRESTPYWGTEPRETTARLAPSWARETLHRYISQQHAASTTAEHPIFHPLGSNGYDQTRVTLLKRKTKTGATHFFIAGHMIKQDDDFVKSKKHCPFSRNNAP